MKADQNYLNEFDPDFAELIEAYRHNIHCKYSQANLAKYPEFVVLPPEKLETLIQYFLDLVYPSYEKRKELDRAFSSLKHFVHSPSKVFHLLTGLGFSLWTMGRYLPEAFSAGIMALHSYLNAHALEDLLLDASKPFLRRGESIRDEKIFRILLKTIPPEKADLFRKETTALFRTLTHRQVVDRIIRILEVLVAKMESHPDVYTEQDRSGIGHGLYILREGRRLLETLTDSESEIVVRAIDRIEEDYYQSCFSE